MQSRQIQVIWFRCQIKLRLQLGKINLRERFGDIHLAQNVFLMQNNTENACSQRLLEDMNKVVTGTSSYLIMMRAHLNFVSGTASNMTQVVECTVNSRTSS